MALLGTGTLRIDHGREQKSFAVSGGFLAPRLVSFHDALYLWAVRQASMYRSPGRKPCTS
jgi:hypothetical protein